MASASLLRPLAILFQNLVRFLSSVVVFGYDPEAKWNDQRRFFSSFPDQKRTQVIPFERQLVRQASKRNEDPRYPPFRVSPPISAEFPLPETPSPSAVTDSQAPLPAVF
jgi:hypothetical protein